MIVKHFQTTAERLAYDVTRADQGEKFQDVEDGIIYIATKVGRGEDVWAAMFGVPPPHAFARATVPFGASIAIDLDDASWFVVTLTGNATMANPINASDGARFSITIKQDSAGARQLSWSDEYRFDSEPQVSQYPYAVDRYWFSYDESDGLFYEESRTIGYRAPPPSTAHATIDSLGCKPGYFTGSMTAASDELVLSTLDHHFAVGDTIIVEVGGEAGAGARATVGVGGTWPETSFANVATLLASGDPGDSPGLGFFAAYAQTTGDVYYWDSGAWHIADPEAYFFTKFYPLALRATVTDVDGATLTLSADSVAATTNARVWFDCEPLVAAYLDVATPSLRVTPGQWALGINIGCELAGMHLFGDDRDSCILLSPRGCQSLRAIFTDTHNARIHDLTLKGNARTSGYSHGLPDYDIGRAPAVLTLMQGDDCEVSDVKVIDSMHNGFSFSFCSGGTATRVRYEATDEVLAYMGWRINASDCEDVTFESCEYDSDYLDSGYETFKSRNIQFLNCTSRNGMVATNGSADWLFDGLVVNIEADSMPNDPNEVLQSVFDHNNNINDDADDVYGGQIRNSTLTIEGNPGESFSAVISRHSVLDDDYPGATYGPGLVLRANGFATRCISAAVPSAQRVTVTGVIADGQVRVANGTVTGCAAPLIVWCPSSTSLGLGNSFDAFVEQCV